MSSDTEVLVAVGYDLVIKVARIVAETICYGIYLVLMYFLIVVFSRPGWTLKRSAYLVVVTVVMFAGCTAFLAMDIADVIGRLRIILIHNPDQALEEKSSRADDSLKKLTWTGEILFIFMLTLGDSVVVWRTWVLYQNEKKYLILPLATWTGSVVAALFELGCDIKTRWAIVDIGPSAGSVGAATCAKADTSSFSLSFATNIICTSLIVMHRKFMIENLGSARRRTQVDKILALLCESGSVYLVLYILQAVPIYGGTISPNTLIAMEVVNAIIQQAMGMYPTAIVVLCQMQKSLWDSVDLGQSGVSNNSIQFTPHRARPLVTSGGTIITTVRSLGGMSGESTNPSTARVTAYPDTSGAVEHEKQNDDLVETIA